MQLKNSAVAGTLESCDVQISVFPNAEGGIEISLNSIVKAMFGDSIRQTAEQVLDELGVTDAVVQINDKGAFDWVIRARMQAALCRAAGIDFDWKGAGA